MPDHSCRAEGRPSEVCQHSYAKLSLMEQHYANPGQGTEGGGRAEVYTTGCTARHALIKNWTCRRKQWKVAMIFLSPTILGQNLNKRRLAVRSTFNQSIDRSINPVQRLMILWQLWRLAGMQAGNQLWTCGALLLAGHGAPPERL